MPETGSTRPPRRPTPTLEHELTDPTPLPPMFNAAKDAISSRAAQAWANNLIARYGRIEHLKIDSRRKTLEASCQLEGESRPVTIRIDDYVVETEGARKFLRATRFTCNRPWLQNVLTDYGSQQRIELPPIAAAAL